MISFRVAALTLGVALLAGASGAWAQDSPAGVAALANPSALKQIEDEFVRLGEQVRGFVVNIDAQGKMNTDSEGSQGMEGYEDLFRHFFNLPQGPNAPNIPNIPMPNRPLRPPVASGSGFIFDKQGHIITNNHVVQDADKITVRVVNGREYEATVVGTDPDTDVAVLKIEPSGDLPVAPLGDSDSLKVGQFAIAAGSPRGLEGSVSFGHISALGRNELDLPGLRFQNFIQTDAAINLGNSGGPLCNVHGEVIGINTAIVFGAQSLGFAIPINTAKKVVPQLIERGRVVRGYLGVQIRNVDDFAEALGLPDSTGAYVEEVQPDTPAQRAGIQSYDVVRKINGKEVKNRDELVRMVSEMEPGSTVNLEVWRNKQPIQVEVKLDEYKADVTTAADSRQSGGGTELYGLTVRPLTSELAERLGLDSTLQGVIITDIKPNSPAAIANLQPGDIITEVAMKKVTNVQEFRKVMTDNAKPGGSVLIKAVTRGGQSVTRLLKVPAANN